MDLKVKDLRRHMDPVEGKTLSDFQIHCFLLMHQAMQDAEAEKQDALHQAAMEEANPYGQD
jgi:hypothetical protein